MTSLSKYQRDLDGKVTQDSQTQLSCSKCNRKSFNDRINSFVWTFVKMMKYTDTVYWYDQLESGLLKSIRDRFMMHPQKTWLSDMPPEIVEMIFKNLGCRDRNTLRQVSKAIRTQIDRIKCRVYNKVDLRIHEIDEVELIIDDQYYVFSTDDFTPNYPAKDSEPIKCVGGLKEALALLYRLLSVPGVKTKLFDVLIWGEYDDEIVKTVKETIKSSENRIAVRDFQIEAAFEDQMIVFMSWMEPGILEEFVLYSPDDDVHAEEIMFTEQWKQAKELTLLGLVCPHSSFVHYSRLTVGLTNGISDVDLLSIKNACLASPSFECCCLRFVDVDRVGAILGPKKVKKPDTGKIFSVEYDVDEVIFKHNNHFDYVGLTINGDESAVLKLDGESIQYENGLGRNKGNKKPGNWKHALNHLAEVWRISKLEIDELSIEFHSLGAEASKIKQAVDTFFKGIGYKIPVTSLHMKIDSEDQLQVVLPHLEPGTLKTIKIDGNGSIGEDEEGKPEYLRIENGLESAQLMKARSLHVTFIKLPYDALLHYSDCTGFFHQFNEAEIVQIKNGFLAKPEMSCSLTLHYREALDEERIKSLLGPSSINIADTDTSGTFTIEVETSFIRFKKTSRYRWQIGPEETDSDSDESNNRSDGSNGDSDETDSDSDESDVSYQSDEPEIDL